MQRNIEKIVIVGGGTAGWISAGLLAASFSKNSPNPKKIYVIESPDIPTIGVGEGTWPSMRQTLHDIGIDERDFIRECGASFKQGSKFCGWRDGKQGDYYYHPFDPPADTYDLDMIEYWRLINDGRSFSNSLCPQESICELHLAPKKVTSPDYVAITNYGYHLDAGKFASIIKSHCLQHLNVTLIADNMTNIMNDEDGYITGVNTADSGVITGDFFIDCTGFHALLIGKHYDIPIHSTAKYLFSDRALAVQVPHGDCPKIASATLATAQHAGWIWDIGLFSRRGVGHVYSSAHSDEASIAKNLRHYLNLSEAEFDNIPQKHITFSSGYREQFWVKNCLAIGLSAGFVEPLEASALMLIETTTRALINQLHDQQLVLNQAAEIFNMRFADYWTQIIYFLKLHYVLSQRPEDFWQMHRDSATIPDKLLQDLEQWKRKLPNEQDLGGDNALFPLASYNYVLCGMGFDFSHIISQVTPHNLDPSIAADIIKKSERLQTILQDNHATLSQICGAGL